MAQTNRANPGDGNGKNLDGNGHDPRSNWKYFPSIPALLQKLMVLI